MTIATLKDFEIENIEEDYYTGSEFQGTWADNTCELCNVTIDISHNDKYYQLTIKPSNQLTQAHTDHTTVIGVAEKEFQPKSLLISSNSSQINRIK